MNNKYKIVLALAWALVCSTAEVYAQHTYSGYFTDGYLFRHEMNPAAGNEQSYVSMVGIGNVDFSVRGNLGLKHVLYNVNGKTTTFLNPAVSTDEFLSKIKDNNRIRTDLNMQLLGVGFKAFGGYNTIGLSARANVNVNVPGALLRLAKQGIENKTYDISDFRAHAEAYTELAFGHSRDINENLRVGAKLKILIGAGNVDAEFQKAQLALGEDAWTAVTDAKVQASVKGLTYKTETKMRGAEGEKQPHTYVSDLDYDKFGMNGFGLAIDLGAEYKLDDDWRFSAALLDLGFIKWNNNMVASTNGEKTFTTDKYIFNVDDEAKNSFENEGDRLMNDLCYLYELQNNGNEGGRARALGATFNVGAEYTLPVYRNLTFGLLNSTRLQGAYSWTQFRLSANVAPAKIFSAGMNLGVGSFGADFGWIINFHPNGFNFFLGMDHILGSLSKQGIPLASNSCLNIGMNFPF
ncbi:MAG: hypothetical protein II947_02940 [Bacteroidaceae bacterium]|nr:hypothetical protein [Bacteroidaceae bacterium]